MITTNILIYIPIRRRDGADVDVHRVRSVVHRLVRRVFCE